MTDASEATFDMMDRTTEIVVAYVGQNSVPLNELPNLIRSIHEALATLKGTAAVEVEAVELKPAVSVKKSVTDDAIICLEDGKRFKSLKRHLMSAYGMTPDAYRAKWNLPATYPMVAPAYASARSELARSIGLGRKSTTARPPEPVSEPAEAPAPKRGRGRPRSTPKVAAE